MYCLLKIHKTAIVTAFIVASKNGTTKLLSDIISKIFKMVFNALEDSHNKVKMW